MARRKKWSGRAQLSRRPARIDPRQRVLIVCEGEVTEKGYFENLRREEECQLVEIVISKKTGVPKTLVEVAVEEKKKAEAEAKREADTNLLFDEIWCVFDVDDHPKLADAYQQARAASIRLAVSNPCFELWILLHFQDQTAHIDRKPLAHAVKGHLPRYRKEVPYAELKPHYSHAVSRSVSLERMHSRNRTPGGNPSTGVRRLTEKARRLGKEQLLRDLQRR